MSNDFTYQPDTRPTEELVKLAVASYENPDECAELIEILQDRGTQEVFEAAMRLCDSEDARERVIGAAILSGINRPDDEITDEATERLIQLLEDDRDPDVLETAAFAVGDREEPCDAAEPLLELVSHESEGVRQGVAYALGTVQACAKTRQVLARMLGALVQLTSDTEAEVRAEAAEALVHAKDTEEIHSALDRLSTDRDADVRAAAILALAERNDPKVVDLLEKELAPIEPVNDLILEAAIVSGNPRLLPLLRRLKKSGKGGELVEDAIRACE